MIYPPIKNQKLTIRERFMLWFIRPKISVDPASGSWLAYKVWRGRVYILKEGK